MWSKGFAISESDTLIKNTHRSYFKLSQPLQEAHAPLVRKKKSGQEVPKIDSAKKYFLCLFGKRILQSIIPNWLKLLHKVERKST